MNKMLLFPSSQPTSIPEEKVKKIDITYLQTLESGETHISPHIYH